MRKKSKMIVKLFLCGALIGVANTAIAACSFLSEDHAALKTILADAILAADGVGGLDNPMWLTVVNRNGAICEVVFSGADRHAVWPGSRAISAQKAYTGIAFSTAELALSSANLYAPTQPEGTLYGLQESNPVEPRRAYAAPASAWGTAVDPLISLRMGGINVFGGGLALYDDLGTLVGGIGVSGDTSCTDHNVAWVVRDALDGMDNVPAGVDAGTDNMIVDVDGAPFAAFSHPQCSAGETTFTDALPAAFPIGP